MKKILFAALLAGSMVPAAAFACGKDCDCQHKKDKSAQADAKGEKVAAADKAAEKFKLIHVDDLASMEKAKTAHVFDANTVEFRAKYGVIPGATLLSSFNAYSLKELPAAKDAKLVFYCANTKCNASHQAAARAVGAGYTDVSVMADGLQGWKSAGQPVDLPKS